MATNNYYAVLGLLHTAEPVVVKAAFKALAQRYHPDKFKGDLATLDQGFAEWIQAFVDAKRHGD